MPPSSPFLTRSILVGVLIVSTTCGASALTVERVNKLIDGVFTPVLVVKDNGETYIHRLGEDGLTRSILFDPKRALAWARDKYGADTVRVAGEGGGDDTRGGAGSAAGDDDDDDDDGGGGTC
jgi:hypothetical protein